MSSDDAKHWRVALYGFWLFVIFVSVFDGYLMLQHRHMALDVEQNPVGRALIQLNSGGVTYLLSAKLGGTILAASLILTIHAWRPRLAIVIVAIVAALQALLLWYLLRA